MLTEATPDGIIASVAGTQEIGSPKIASAPLERASDWRALRLGFGITIAFLLAMAFDWTNVHTPLYIAIYIQQLSMAGSLG